MSGFAFCRPCHRPVALRPDLVADIERLSRDRTWSVRLIACDFPDRVTGLHPAGVAPPARLGSAMAEQLWSDMFDT